jgi:hypothetical protein
VSDFPAAEFRLDGNPAAIRSSASRWSTFGQEASDAATQIQSLDTSLFIGPEGDQYRQGLNHSLPPHLKTTGTAYTTVADALSDYAHTLSGLQDRMHPLAAKAPALWQAAQAAQGRVTAAQAADRQHTHTQTADALTKPPDQPAPPDTYHSDTAAATATLSQAHQAWNDCLTAARAVKTDLHTAINHCTTTIQHAADMRFAHNPHGFGALVAGFKDFVKDHVEGLAKLSGVLKLVSGIAGVLSVIPVIGEIALPIALITGGAALAIDASIKFATGQGSWTTIAIDVGLLALPGIGKLARAGIKTMRGARVGDGPVVFRSPAGASPEEVAQVRRYVDAAERARKDRALSETGRVSTKGELRRESSKEARRERVRAERTDTPYEGHVGHAPDTTWTGKPEAYEWHDQTPRVNTSLGRQALNYPEGYKPTKFVFDPSSAP